MENNGTLTIEALAPRIRQRKISPLELTRFLLDRIAEFQPAINAYITITAENALAQARQAEKDIARGHYRGALHGIPISLKDLFHTRGICTTAGSQILRRFVPEKNAVAVDRLLQAGCVLLGKTNLHEFAYGPTNLNPHFGPVRNPWATDRISGGSSGGSAASVVSAQAIASLGTDTGGSIRIPAAACGCVGLKPTYGRIPTEGVVPLSFTLDHVGPLTRCVADAAILFEALAQPAVPVLKSLRQGARLLRIGVPRHYFFSRIQPEIRRAVVAAIKAFEELGAIVTEVDLRGLEETASLAAEITGDEAFSYHKKWLDRIPGKYGEDVCIRLELSRNATAAAYIQALRALDSYRQRMDHALASVDLLIAPTLPVAAPALDQTEAVLGRTREDIRLALLRLTRPGNLSGLPAISIPCGFTRDQLPIGLQLLGRRWGEATLLRAAYAYECATPWHQRFPSDASLAAG